MHTVIHIGQMKTGTTTLQRMLARSRGHLWNAGILYPSGREFNHTTAISDLLMRDLEAQSRLTAGERNQFERLGPLIAGRFSQLQGVYDRAPAHRVRLLSAENLVTAGESTRHAVINRVGKGHITALVTTRPLRRLLPSMYQQHARTGRVPDFESWLEDALHALARGDQGHPVSSLRLDALEKSWFGHVDQFKVVDMDRHGFSHGLAEAWTVMAQGVDLPTEVASERNQSYSVEYVIAVQEFMRARVRPTNQLLKIQEWVDRQSSGRAAEGSRFAVSDPLAEAIAELETTLAGGTVPQEAWTDLARTLRRPGLRLSKVEAVNEHLVDYYRRQLRAADRTLGVWRAAANARDWGVTARAGIDRLYGGGARQ